MIVGNQQFITEKKIDCSGDLIYETREASFFEKMFDETHKVQEAGFFDTEQKYTVKEISDCLREDCCLCEKRYSIE